LSYLLITHDVSVICAMAHHVMVMKAGKVVEAGTFEQVLNNPKAAYTKILVGA
jgi:ABC-type microcin C transport system duplicated ATPase subunit YejF